MNFIQTYISPIGKIIIEANESSLTRLFIDNLSDRKDNPNQLTEDAVKQLKLYFEGKIKQFNLPLSVDGTDFQNSVWHSLQKIPYGKTISYKELAKSINNPKAVRAVGTANGKNPFPIIIPCHRVINNGGGLGGFAYGLKMKQSLLNLEQSNI